MAAGLKASGMCSICQGYTVAFEGCTENVRDAVQMSGMYCSSQACSAHFRGAPKLVGMHQECQGCIADVRDAGIDAK